MFERYVEKARRCLFFARYEASVFGSPYIETEHLLLGLLREDKELAALMSLQHSDIEAIRKQIESRSPRRDRISVSVDLPVGAGSKRALSYAVEEADKFKHKQIDTRHLMLGLLRTEGCLAANILGEIGITYPVLADMVGQLPGSLDPLFERLRVAERPVERPSVWQLLAAAKMPAESLQSTVAALQHLVDGAVRHLQLYSDSYGDQLLKRKAWSRKEALGHLIDWATAHHQWFATALVEPAMNAREYPQEDRVNAQFYKDCLWPDLVDTWVSLNRILIHVLTSVPEEKVNTPCRIGIEKPVPLSVLAGGYVMRNEDIMGQILAKL